MNADRFRKPNRVIAPFEDADDAAAGVFVSNAKNGFRQPGEVFNFQVERADRVLAMGVKAGANQDELWPNLRSKIKKCPLEAVVKILWRCAVRDRHIGDHPQASAR